MLSVSLAQPDGKVFGGRVENLLIAATPIKVRFFISTLIFVLEKVRVIEKINKV